MSASASRTAISRVMAFSLLALESSTRRRRVTASICAVAAGNHCARDRPGRLAVHRLLHRRAQGIDARCRFVQRIERRLQPLRIDPRQGCQSPSAACRAALACFRCVVMEARSFGGVFRRRRQNAVRQAAFGGKVRRRVQQQAAALLDQAVLGVAPDLGPGGDAVLGKLRGQGEAKQNDGGNDAECERHAGGYRRQTLPMG